MRLENKETTNPTNTDESHEFNLELREIRNDLGDSWLSFQLQNPGLALRAFTNGSPAWASLAQSSWVFISVIRGFIFANAKSVFITGHHYHHWLYSFSLCSWFGCGFWLVEFIHGSLLLFLLRHRERKDRGIDLAVKRFNLGLTLDMPWKGGTLFKPLKSLPI